MIPVSSTHDKHDTGTTHLVFACQFVLTYFARRIPITNLYNVFLAKNRSPVSLSFHPAAAVASLIVHITNIFKLSAKPKVGRIHANGIVTGMENTQILSRHISAMSNYPRKDVCSARFPAHIKLSVSSRNKSARRPRPAFIGLAFIDFRPEPHEFAFCEFDLFAGLREWFSSFFHSSFMTEVRAWMAAITASTLDYFKPLSVGVKSHRSLCLG